MADKAVVTQTTLDAIGQAIIAKGGATAPMTPVQMPGAIQAIPSGGEEPLYIPPSDWPDIREIIKNDVPPDGVVSSDNIITLFYGTDTPGFRINTHTVKWDDGVVTTGVLTRQLPGRGFHWAISYGVTDAGGNVTFGPVKNGFVLWIYGIGNSSLTNAAVTSLGSCTNLLFVDIPRFNVYANNAFGGDSALQYVGKIGGGTVNNLSQFFNCYSIKTLAFADDGFLDVLTATSETASIFRIVAKDGIKAISSGIRFAYSSSLPKIPIIDFSAVETMANTFRGCTNLNELPDVLDLSNVTDSSSTGTGKGMYNAFKAMYGLTKVPTHVTCAFSFGFPDSQMIDHDSIATFDSHGNVIGGLAYHINQITMAASVVSVSDLPEVGDRFTIYDVAGTKYRWRYKTNAYTVAASGYEDTATITLHSFVKSKFTNEEQLSVEASFNEKGWTLAW